MKTYASGIRASELTLVEETMAPAEASPPAEAPTLPVTDAVRAPQPITDKFLAAAISEYDAGHIDQPLWVRAVAQCNGDRALAKPAYLLARAAALRVEKRLKPPEGPTQRAPAPRAAGETSPAGKDRDEPPVRPSTRPTRKQLTAIGAVLGCLVVASGFFAIRLERAPAVSQTVAADKSPTPKSRSGVAAVAASNTVTPHENVATVQTVDFPGKLQALKSAGDWNLLVLHAVEWTRKQPENPDAWRELAAGYVKLRQLGEALDAATKATQVAPSDFRVWQTLGQVNVALQRSAEALAAFEQAITLNDRDIVSLVQAGLLKAQLGRFPEARVAFDTALAASPENVDALCGAAATATKEARVKDAEALVRQIKSLDAVCRDSSGTESVRVVIGAPAKGNAVPPLRR
ncbi:MAG TPA: tetratricopeptide repeat protein [Casimicrobiaceae bacterium]|jgi:tetratricopeptide (TPR) repeat protein